MIKHLIPPVLIAVVIAISGSSCHDPAKDDSATAVQAPPTNGGGARMIPAQQRMPSTMPRPRM